MIIDTDTKEGKALVALAKFGDAVLNLDDWTDSNAITNAALRFHIVGYDYCEQYATGIHQTDLAKLPEGL